MRYERTTTVDAETADAVFAYVVGQLLRRELPVEVDRDSRTAVWGPGPGADCAGQLYVTDARPRGVRVTVVVETGALAASRARAEIDRALAALAG
ncbi:hypothetical protein ACTWQF_07180 [Streptomyces sp. 8N114]|uniref:hypothetical protein n=1 Tax=Streptomyces sp. 8N114 TaxID=3457419 RepID=UPI003FD05DDB